MPYVPNSDTRNRRLRRRAKLSVCAIAFALASCGDSPPAPPVLRPPAPSGQSEWSYWSTDMSPVKITFKRADPVPGAELPPDMLVPRAYIKFALPYKWPTPQTMPDVATDVEVGSLILFLAHDTGSRCRSPKTGFATPTRMASTGKNTLTSRCTITRSSGNPVSINTRSLRRVRKPGSRECRSMRTGL